MATMRPCDARMDVGVEWHRQRPKRALPNNPFLVFLLFFNWTTWLEESTAHSPTISVLAPKENWKLRPSCRSWTHIASHFKEERVSNRSNWRRKMLLLLCQVICQFRSHSSRRRHRHRHEPSGLPLSSSSRFASVGILLSFPVGVTFKKNKKLKEWKRRNDKKTITHARTHART